MKRIAVVAAIMLMGLMSNAQGQGQGQGAGNGSGQNQNVTPEERAQKMTDRMKTELSLTDAQYKEVYAINLAKAKKQTELEKGNKEQRSAMRDQHLADLGNVLTPEQMEKAKELKATRKANLKHKHGKKNGQTQPE